MDRHRPAHRRPRGSRRGLIRAAALALALAAAGCPAKQEPGAAAGGAAGRAVLRGPVRAVKASADGAWLAVLEGCNEARGQFLPPRTASCDLRLVPAAGGDARRVAGAVTTLPHGLLWSPAGATLAALGEYEYPTARGTLVVVRAGGAPRTLGTAVSFAGFAPGTEDLLFVADGRLLVSRGGGEPEPVAGLDRVGSLEPGPGWSGGAGPALLVRQGASAGAALSVVGADGRARRVAERSGDYAIAPGGAYAYTVQDGGGYALHLAGPRQAVLGKEVQAFAFSRDGRAIAFLADATPGKQGDLHLALVAKPGDAVLAREVGELRWAQRAPRLAWLERFDARVRSGTAGAGGLDLPSRTYGANVTDLELSADGKRLAFLQHTTRGGYSVDLMLAQLDAPPGTAAVQVAQGAFGFSFSPDARWLYYRTRCVRNGEGCDVERVPAEGLAPGAKPERVAEGAKSFEYDPRDPGRLLVTWQRMDRDALDVGVWKDGKLTRVDTYVLPGSAQLVGPDSRRLAYAVLHEKRQGAYVAELPR
ncbi:conserved hypothetical protein [Anaeromyxobacter sp. K]|uniref:hypothetical protein n=1 Tax=Anaeromyxobacter sp. (strain K) TaxID=447217 RepID=UPI00015F8827|nr:hypothetical protein [Anaeromyxobacter sp. K]ACG74014.1 conserved hypothetical protein [Anaeromyxobacter sp. K]